MSNLVPYTLSEGQSTTRPLFFHAENYPYWKERIRIFIQSTNYAIWKIVVSGPEVSKKIVEEQQVPKTKEEWNIEDLKKVELNAKVINVMHYTISFEEYRKISRCKTVKRNLG